MPATALAADDERRRQDRPERARRCSTPPAARRRPGHRLHRARSRRRRRRRRPRGVETTDLSGFDAVAAYLTQDEIDALAASDSVDLIVADNPVFGFDYASSLDVTNLAIGLGKVAAPAAGGPTGAGVGVAVLDSGIATTSDLGSSRIVGWKDFVNKQKAPYDDAGHGTFVAGLIAGDGTASLPLDQGGYATRAVPRRRARRPTSSASRSSTRPARDARPR